MSVYGILLSFRTVILSNDILKFIIENYDAVMDDKEYLWCYVLGTEIV